ncbi:MAG: hypothetical protein H7196_02425, partial [candidate division SR1 bacterium]|nr:hypothetical protein [candidate division SR1 bacterium]
AIQGQSYTSNTITTDKTIVVGARPFDPEIDIIKLLEQSNLKCTPEITTTFSTVTCVGKLPDSITPPTNLALNVEGTKGQKVVFTEQVFTALNLDTGTITGVRKIQAQLYSNPSQLAYVNGTKLDTGKTIQVNAKQISDDDIKKIGTTDTQNPFITFSCNDDKNIVSGTPSTTCIGVLKPGYTISNDLKVGFDSKKIVGTCTVSGQNVNCKDVSVPIIPDTYSLIFITSDKTVISNYKITVVASPVLPRTGGSIIINITGVITISIVSYWVYKRYVKKEIYRD